MAEANTSTAYAPALQLAMAHARDAHTLSRIASQGFSDSFGYLYTPENLDSHLKKTCSPAYFEKALAEGDTIIIAYLEGKAVGYAKAGKVGLPVAPDFPAAELQRLYVLSPYQGQKIGDALMQAALQLPFMQAAHGVYVGAWENNHRAHRFYEKYGFTQVGEYFYHVGPHTDREFIMLRTQEKS